MELNARDTHGVMSTLRAVEPVERKRRYGFTLIFVERSHKLPIIFEVG